MHDIGAGPRPGANPTSAERALRIFLGIAAVALVVVSAGAFWVSELIARANAVESSEGTAERITASLVAPVLREALAGVPGRYEELDRRLENRLTDPDVERIRIVAADGTVLLASDESTGSLAMTPQVRQALAGQTATALEGGSDADGEHGIVVAVPTRAGVEPLVVEVAFGYGTVARETEFLRRQILPLAVGSLLLLQLLQVPIAVSLVRRIRRHELEREDLLARTVTASERERRAIAADVHDGPLQDLAGISYALSALRPDVPAEQQGTFDRVISTVRDAVHSLRRLLVDLYPPDLGSGGLPSALEDLAEPLRRDGLDVTLDIEPVDGLTPEAAAVVYRTAKEALANIARHASAEHAHVSLTTVALGGRPTARLEVVDDGVGLRPGSAEHASDGHLGLTLMRDRLSDIGGSFWIGPAAGRGTSVVAHVPMTASVLAAPPAPRRPDRHAPRTGGARLP